MPLRGQRKHPRWGKGTLLQSKHSERLQPFCKIKWEINFPTERDRKEICTSQLGTKWRELKRLS